MARPLISLPSHHSYTLTVCGWLLPALVWSMLYLAIGFEFNSPAQAETGQSSPASHPSLKQAKRLIDAGQAEEAITVLRRFLATSPKPELLDDIYLLLGAALYSTKQYGDALKYLLQLQTEFPNSEVTDRGKLMQARVHAAMGNIDLALPILTGLRNLSKDDSTKREALRWAGDTARQNGRRKGTVGDDPAKAAVRRMWALGDYHRFATRTVWEVGPILVEACGITAGQRVLDVAAGSGNVAIRAAERGADVVAADLAPENFEAGRKEASLRGVELDWIEAKGTGKIHSFTLVRVPRNPAFKDEVPIYYVNVILDEGVIIESKLVGDDKEKVRLGGRVRAVFQETHDPAIKLPCFELAG